VLSFLDSFFNWLEHYSGSPWFYVVIFSIALLDSVVPVVPSESLVIIGGVSAGLHQLHWSLVIVAAAAGAFAGDNISYQIGNRFSTSIRKRYERSVKGQRRLQWAHNQIQLRGGELLITARFIPGGRTLLTLSCGITNQDRRWFMKWIAIATPIWAMYGTLLGFIGGRSFQDNHTKAFLVALSIAIGATLTLEIIRHFRNRFGSSATPPHN
jgi:membrane protein DedA with SNARE-associated domain